jgi:hypothetical protein
MVLAQPLYSFKLLKHSGVGIRIEEGLPGKLFFFTLSVLELKPSFSKEMQGFCLCESYFKSKLSCSGGKVHVSVVWQTEACDNFTETIVPYFIVSLILLDKSKVGSYFQDFSSFSETVGTADIFLPYQTIKFYYFRDTFTD